MDQVKKVPKYHRLQLFLIFFILSGLTFGMVLLLKSLWPEIY